MLAHFDSSEAYGFAVAPDADRILAYGMASGTSTFIETTGWVQEPSGLPVGEILLAAYSPDGQLRLTAGVGGSLALRDAETLEIIHRLRRDGGLDNAAGFQTLAFSEDGTLGVTALDGDLRLRDTQTGEMIGQPIPSLQGSSPAVVAGVAPVGVTLAEGFAQIWRFDPDAWPDLACRAAGRNLTREEWNQFGPRDVEYHPTCPMWPMPT